MSELPPSGKGRFGRCRSVFAWLLIVVLAGCAAQDRATPQPLLILISIDGMGWNARGQARTPTLDRIAAAGVHARSMRPVFPSMTFPNHYSIATGLYPAQHGIVDNSFPDADRNHWYRIWDREAVQDGKWYGGEPIWVAAEKNGMTAAAFFFVGTEAPIGGISPSYWFPYDGDIAGEDRIDKVIDWLSLPVPQRPQLITLYFEDVDEAGHDFGPGAPQWTRAIERVDGYLARLLAGLNRLDLADQAHLIIVSDHGQVTYRDEPAFVIGEHVSLEGVTAVDHGSFAALYLDQSDGHGAMRIRDAINDHWRHGKAYSRNAAPALWKLTDDRRFADVYAVADAGWKVVSEADLPYENNSVGDHGWAPEVQDMHGIFFAMGPRLPTSVLIDQISVVDVYPLMAEILGLPLPAGVDPNGNALLPLLDPDPSR